ncbi:hypothetical protein [Salinarimonas soli]|uniref:Uncharacterized protein n=1 Tax=Salinarimonas soli TaxID=1638099 RepID=A0A5B2V8U4_9HYPH|nr:hypothetical protein [Salinarimonas soli]KAA2235424.1 hypothetical protein F0L46_19535 [Salinarimonas soli]
MTARHSIGTALSALALGGALLATPVEARDFRGLLPGLIAGSIAAGAFSAAGRAGTREVYVVAPEPFDDDEEEIEVVAPRRLPRERPASLSAPVRPRAVPAPPARRVEAARERRKPDVAPPAAAPPAALATCGSSLTAVSRRHGAVRVDVSPAGAPTRLKDGALTVPLNAVVEYRGGAKTHVRRARVSCRLDSSGQVVALR